MNQIVFMTSSDVASIVIHKEKCLAMHEDGCYGVIVYTTKELEEFYFHCDSYISSIEELPENLGELVFENDWVCLYDDNYQYTVTTDKNVKVYYRKHEYNTPDIIIVVDSGTVSVEKNKLSEKTKEELQQMKIEAAENRTFIC